MNRRLAGAADDTFLDSAFLYFETPTMDMHVGGLMLVDPATMAKPYSFADMRALIDSPLPLAPCGSVRRVMHV